MQLWRFVATWTKLSLSDFTFYTFADGKVSRFEAHVASSSFSANEISRNSMFKTHASVKWRIWSTIVALVYSCIAPLALLAAIHIISAIDKRIIGK